MLEEDKATGDLKMKDNLDLDTSKTNALRELFALLILLGFTVLYFTLVK
jgi:hypothetical protein